MRIMKSSMKRVKFYEDYQLCRAATIMPSLLKDQLYILGELGGNEEGFPGLFLTVVEAFHQFHFGLVCSDI